MDSGYASLPFPFREQCAPHFEIRRDWNAKALLGYVSTWSATRRALEGGAAEKLEGFATDLLELWGEQETQRPVVWPVHVRLGTVDSDAGAARR